MIPIGINKKQWDFIANNRDKDEIHLYGSGDSSKTWTMVQYFTFEMLLKEKHIKFNCIKKTRASVKFAIYQFWKERLQEWEILCQYHDTDLLITFANGNKISCFGLDKLQKVKGRWCNYTWINEAIELTHREFMQCSGWGREKNENYWMEELKNKKKVKHKCINQLFCDYNPESEKSFLKPLTEKVPKNIAVKRFTYKDNRFLTEERRRKIENYEYEDKIYWTIYGKGEWATLTGLIYQFGLNWDIVPAQEFNREFADTEYGLDFGYNVPSALSEINFSKDIPKDCPEVHKSKQHIYERELIYQTHLDPNQLVEKMKEAILPEHRHRVIWADSENPSDIELIKKAGFPGIKPALKPKDSVVAGIREVKSYFIHLHEDSINAQDEKRMYKWKVDKNDKPLDEPLKENNHIQDEERYVIFSRKHSASGEIVIAV